MHPGATRLEAELIAHLAEVDERRLYTPSGGVMHPLPRRTSLWDFCLLDLGFSENVAASRIAVARESRQFPRMLEMLRQGRIHLSGLRMLCGHLTTEGSEELLAEAAGKTKRQIEELLARRYPKPAVPDRIRKLPATPPAAMPEAAPQLPFAADGSSGPPTPRTSAPARAVVAPLSAEAYRVQFTASPELRDKIRQAQELLRHQLPSGDLAPILERALTLLIAQVKKERFGVGRKPRSGETRQGPARSRRVPTAIRRAVYTPSGGVMHPEIGRALRIRDKEARQKALDKPYRGVLRITGRLVRQAERASATTRRQMKRLNEEARAAAAVLLAAKDTRAGGAPRGHPKARASIGQAHRARAATVVPPTGTIAAEDEPGESAVRLASHGSSTASGCIEVATAARTGWAARSSGRRSRTTSPPWRQLSAEIDRRAEPRKTHMLISEPAAGGGRRRLRAPHSAPPCS